MSRFRVLVPLSLFVALSGQFQAYAEPATRIATVKGKSLCLIEGTAAPNCLAPSPGDVRLPLWSKDGELVTFIENAPPSEALAILHVVDRYGQSLLSLPIKPVVAGEINSGMRAVEALQWVDSHRIAVSGSVNPSTQEVLVIDLQRDAVADEFIDDGGGVSFSPDGKHTAQLTGAPHFTPSAKRRPVLRVDGKDIILPSMVDAADFGTPLWSPDSRSVAIPMKDTTGRDVVAYWQPQGLRILNLPVTTASKPTRPDLFWSGNTLQLRRASAATTPLRPGEKRPATKAWSINPGIKTPAWTKLADGQPNPARAARVAKANALKLLPADLASTPLDLADVWCQACGIEKIARRTGATGE